MNVRITGVALVLLGGIACRPPKTGPVYLERGVPFTLRAPSAGPAFFSSQQVVFTSAEGQDETLLTTVENTADRLNMVVSTPFGQTLCIVQVTPTGTQVDPRLPLPSWLDLRLLPALVQLANWPLEDLRTGLGTGLELKEEGRSRLLLRKGEIVMRLTFEGAAAPWKTVDVELPQRKVRTRITTLEEAP